MKKLFDLTIVERFIEIIKKGRFYILILGFIDLITLTLSFEVTYRIIHWNKAAWFYENEKFLQYFIVLLPIWLFILLITKNAQIPRTRRYSRLFLEFSQFTLFNIIILAGIALLYDNRTFNPFFVITCASSTLFFLYTARLIEYKFFKLYRSTGHNYINIIIIADSDSDTLINKLINNKEWGFRTLFIVSNSKTLRAKYGDKVKFISEKGIHSVKTLLEYCLVDEVIYTKPTVDYSIINNMLKWCEEVGVVFRYPYQISKTTITNGRISYIYDIPFITFANVPTNSIEITLKNFMDYFMSFITLVMVSPFLIILGVLIRIDSQGPVFFKQARVGLRGRQFYLYKFRTMIVNAEQLRKKIEMHNEMDGPVFKIKNDPRITRIGKFLRKTGLDELPQLINVLKGEMSLIGPRPPLLSEVRQYERWQLRRLSVKPGITCSWQIQPNRNDIKFEHWMKLDLAYIDNWSLQSDFMLLLKTAKTVLWGTGA